MAKKRLSAEATRLVAQGEPLPCKVCKATNHEYRFTTLPMTWSSRCLACGLELRCEQTPAPKPRSPDPSQDDGWPPLWY